MKFFVDVLTGFLELVANGIIHRDLKPANILIHEGSYKLAGSWVGNFGKDGSEVINRKGNRIKKLRKRGKDIFII